MCSSRNSTAELKLFKKFWEQKDDAQQEVQSRYDTDKEIQQFMCKICSNTAIILKDKQDKTLTDTNNQKCPKLYTGALSSPNDIPRLLLLLHRGKQKVQRPPWNSLIFQVIHDQARFEISNYMCAHVHRHMCAHCHTHTEPQLVQLSL